MELELELQGRFQGLDEEGKKPRLGKSSSRMSESMAQDRKRYKEPDPAENHHPQPKQASERSSR
jgi:hypothetical protein